MANREALWISSGAVTQLDGTTDGLEATALDPGAAGALTLGGTNATSVEFGTGIDSVSGALALGGTNASSITVGVEITKDAAEELVIGQNTATSVRVQNLTIDANAIHNAAAEGLVIGGTNTTTISMDSAGPNKITIGGTNASSVQIDGLEITGNTLDTAAAGVLTIGGAGSTATGVQIGTSGETTTILGDLQVDGAETVTGSATFNGNTDIGDAASDTLTITASVDAAINFAAGVTSHLTTTSGDMKFVPEGTTIAQGGLGTALTFTNYTTNGTALTGTGTAFDTELQVGDAIEVDLDGGTTIDVRRVTAIASATALTVNAAFSSDVGPVTHALTTDDNLFEVYNGYADARLSIGKNGGLTVTRGEQDLAPITIANEEDSINAAIYVVDDDASNIVSPAAGDIALSTTGTLYWYTGATWAQAGSAAGNSLQQAYDQGNTITTNDGDALDYTLSNGAFNVSTSSGNDVTLDNGTAASFLATDHDNNKVVLGADAATDLTVEIAAATALTGTVRTITSDSANMTIQTTTSGTLAVSSVAALDMDGTVVTLDGSTSIGIGTAQDKPVTIESTTLDINASGDVTIDTAAAGDTITLTATDAGAVDAITLATVNDGAIAINAADELDIDCADFLTIDCSAGDITLDGNTGVEINSAGGALSIGNDDIDQDVNVGTAGERNVNIGNVSGATAVNVDAGTGGISLESTGAGDITINSDDTLLLDSDGVLELNSSAGIIGIGNDADAFGINLGTGAAARTITVGNATGATALDFNAGSGGVAVDATGSNITLTTNTSGTIQVDGQDGVYIESDAGTLNIGVDDRDQAINIGTQGERTVTVGSAAATEVQIDADLIDLNSDGAVTIDGGSSVAMNSVTTTTIASTTTASLTGGTGLTLASTANDVDILAAGALDMGATAGHVTIDCAADYDIALTAASDADSDITFQAHNGTVTPFNSASNTSLDTRFTDETLVGAINELLAMSSDVTTTVTAGEALTAGDVVYLDKADGSKAKGADADDSAATAVVLGVCAEDIADDATGEVYLVGDVRVYTDLSGATVGDVVYLSDTAGEVSVTAGTGTVLRMGIVTIAGDEDSATIAMQIGVPVTL